MFQSADLAIGPLTRTNQRAAVVDFTQTIAEIHLTLLHSKPIDTRVVAPQLDPAHLPRSGFQYGFIRGSDIERLLQNADDEVSRTIWRGIRDNYNTLTVENIYEGKVLVFLDVSTALGDAWR